MRKEQKKLNAAVEISARHVHLCRADFVKLFGADAVLNKVRDLTVTGEFLSDKSVAVLGARRNFDKVSVLGPLRDNSQVELSRTDCFAVGERNVPLRLSGDLDGSAPIKLAGDKGQVELDQGLIVAKRHLHIDETTAAKFGVSHGDVVSMEFDGARGGRFDNVAVRISKVARPTVHLDTDEGNAIGGIDCTICLIEKEG
jgi:propanediol utilization protein